MLSLSNPAYEKILTQGSDHGVSEERILELIEMYRVEVRREPREFSDLLDVLE